MGHSVRDKYFVLLNMASVYRIVAIHVNETSWAHVWRLRFRYLGTGYDSMMGNIAGSMERRMCRILLHFLFCLKIYGAIFCAMLGFVAMVLAV
jgi:hypothetical protein